MDPKRARAMLSPLVGIYELRHADAHLASRKSSDAVSLLRVDQNAPYITRGYQLLHACVSSIYGICQVIEGWIDEGNKGNGLYQKHGADTLQRPLRSRFRARLMPAVG